MFSCFVVYLFVVAFILCPTRTIIQNAIEIRALIPDDYDNETDDVDQNGIDETNRNGDAQQPLPPPSLSPVEPNSVPINPSNTDDALEQTTKMPAIDVNEQINTNEIGATPTEPAIQVEVDDRNAISTTTASCDVNNGGCEQTCNMVPNGDDNVVECSCNNGFYIDADPTKCLGEFIYFHSFFLCLFVYLLVV